MSGLNSEGTPTVTDGVVSLGPGSRPRRVTKPSEHSGSVVRVWARASSVPEATVANTDLTVAATERATEAVGRSSEDDTGGPLVG